MSIKNVHDGSVSCSIVRDSFVVVVVVVVVDIGAVVVGMEKHSDRPDIP